MAETEDAIQVLTEAVINPYPEALEKLKAAYALQKSALSGFGFGKSKHVQKALSLRNEAKNLIVKEDSAS
jgi:hypothetical protein